MKKLLLLMLGIVWFEYMAPSSVPVHSETMIRYMEMYEARIEKERKEAEFQRFLAHLAFKESSSNPDTTNALGYMGKYQFGRAALADIGITDVTFSEFKRNPSIFPEEEQDMAILSWFELNKRRLQKEIDMYCGKIINGILITEAGILAASHLGGVGGVKRYFREGRNPADINGTTLEKYMREFSQFQI